MYIRSTLPNPAGQFRRVCSYSECSIVQREYNCLTRPQHVVSELQLSARLAPLVYKRVTFAEQEWTSQHYSRENVVKGPAIKHTPAGLAHLKAAKRYRKVADKHYAAAISHLKAGNRKSANESERLGDAHARLATLHRAVANELHVE